MKISITITYTCWKLGIPKEQAYRKASALTIAPDVAVSACVVNACVSFFNYCDSDLYAVDICKPKGDNDKLVSSIFIFNPLPFCH